MPGTGIPQHFPSVHDKETHGKRHLSLDYDLPTADPPPSTQLVAQILDSCFPLCVAEGQGENSAISSMTEPRGAFLLLEEPMKVQTEEQNDSSPSHHEEKAILDECLLCGFRCLQSESLEQHWSHVALEHMETPHIFGCSQCHTNWDTPKPFGEHLLLQHPGEQARLLDRRDLGACNIFQMCFEVSEERLVVAGLSHLFQTPTEQTALPPLKSQEKQLDQPPNEIPGKIIDRCLLCGQGWVTLMKKRAQYRWKHLSLCHLDNTQMFACSVCQKTWRFSPNNFKRHAKVKHPDKTCHKVDQRTANDWDVYEMCFGANPKRSHSPPPKSSKRTKYKLSCSLCGYRVPSCSTKEQKYQLRWVHVSKKHGNGRPLFHCPLCEKSSDYRMSVTYFCRKNHPDKRVFVDNRKAMRELYQRCFLIASALKTG